MQYQLKSIFSDILNYNKKKQKNKSQVILSALCLPEFVNPCGLSTLYRCLPTTMEQDIPFHEIPFNQGLLQLQGELYPSQPIFNHRSQDQLLEFCASFYRQLVVNSLSKGNSSTLNFNQSTGTNSNSRNLSHHK